MNHQQISNTTAGKLHESMLRIRLTEQKIAELLFANEIGCPSHLYIGQEAIAASVCANLNADDYVFSTHRSHGHFLGMGGSLRELFAELYGRATGCSGGKGGSMHLIDRKKGFMGSTPTVGSSISNAVGAALAAKLSGRKQVAVAFFGDGAVEEGVFYESINFASLYALPVIFVCENNLFATHMPMFMRQKNEEIHEKVEVHAIKSVKVDGNDPLGMFSTTGDLIHYAREGNGPCFIEAITFRWLAHVGPWDDLDIGFRKKEDVLAWRSKCPILRLEKEMSANPEREPSYLQEVRTRIGKEIEDALAFAKSSPFPEPAELVKNIFS